MVTDGNSCTATVPVVIGTLSQVQLNLLNTTDLTCAAAQDGGFSVQATNGPPPFTYQIISPFNGAPQSSNTFTGLNAGTYVVKASDGTGCGRTLGITLTAPPPLALDNLTYSTTCVPAVTVVASGGVAPLSYGLSSAGPFQSGNTFTVSSGQSGTVYVLDANGCVLPVPYAAPNIPVLTLNGLPSETLCAGTSFTRSASIANPNGSVTYQWQSSNSGVVGTGSSLTLTPTSSASYTLTVSDNCTTLSTTFAVEVSNPVVSVVNQTAVACFGGADGGFTLSVAGGIGSYSWQIVSPFSGTPQPGGTFSGLQAGSYTVRLTDAGGCTATQSLTITQPGPLTISLVDVAQLGCEITATVTASGGTPPFSYALAANGPFQLAPVFNLTSGQSGTVFVRDAANCLTTAPFAAPVLPVLSLEQLPDTLVCSGGVVSFTASTDSPNGLVTYEWRSAAGVVATGPVANLNPTATTTYTLTASDLCSTQTTSFTVFTSATNLQLANFSASHSGFVCRGSVVAASGLAVGGTGNYWYTWNSGETTPGISRVVNQTEILSLTIFDGCQYRDTVLIVQPFPDPEVVALNAGEVCSGGSVVATALASAGNGVYPTFTWQSPAGVVGTGSTVNLTPTQTTIYTVTVTDGCGNTGTSTLAVPVQPRPVVDAGTNRTFCKDGSTQLNASLVQATGTCEVFWSPVIGLSDPFSLNPTITNLNTTTTYTLRALCNGCEGALDTVRVEVRPRPVVAIVNPNQYRCVDGGSLTFEAIAQGGTPPYTYAWQPASGLNQTTTPVVVANPGQTTAYTLTVTDANGCISKPVVAVATVHPLPQADAGPDQTRCAGQSDSLILGAQTQGQGVGYSYLWSPGTGLNDPTLRNPVARPDVTTTYTLTVTSLPWGCVGITDAVTVTVASPAGVTAGADQTVCFGSSAVLTATVNGGLPAGATVQWTPETGVVNPNSLTTTVVPTVAQTLYQVAVWVGECMIGADEVLVTARPVPTVSVPALAPVCRGQTQKIRVLTQSLTAPYTAQWAPAAQLDNPNTLEPVVTVISDQTYTLTLTSADGCVVTQTVATSLLPTPVVSAHTARQVRLCLGSEVPLNATLTGGTPPVAFAWEPAAELTDPASLNPIWRPTSSYWLKLRATGVGGCAALDSVWAEVVPQPDAEAFISDSVVCAGTLVTLSAIGGFPTGSAYVWEPLTSVLNPTSAQTTANPSVSTTYTLTIVQQDLCTATAEVAVRVIPSGNLAFDHTLPEGCGSLEVSFRSQATGVTAYVWDFGDGSSLANTPNPVHAYPQPGSYTVRLTTTDALCLGSSEVVQQITVHSAPPAELVAWSSVPESGGPALILPDTRVAFTADGIRATQHPVSSVLWDFGDGTFSTEANPEHTYRAAGSYIVVLTVVDAQGCTVRSQGLYRIENPELTFPNVFTPNGDGVNDVWKPVFTGQQRFSYRIYDRWGIQLFQGSETDGGWNGTYGNARNAIPGVYFYAVEHGERIYKGQLTLIRD